MSKAVSRGQALDCSKPFNPEFIGKGWTVWKGPPGGNGLSGEEDIDSRSQTLLININPTLILFKTCLKKSEISIHGEEKLRRLKEKEHFVRFGGNTFLDLWKNCQPKKKKNDLEWFYQKNYLDFFGTILRDHGGCRCVLCLDRRFSVGGWPFCIGGWRWCCRWLGYNWNADNFSVGLSK